MSSKFQMFSEKLLLCCLIVFQVNDPSKIICIWLRTLISSIIYSKDPQKQRFELEMLVLKLKMLSWFYGLK